MDDFSGFFSALGFIIYLIYRLTRKSGIPDQEDVPPVRQPETPVPHDFWKDIPEDQEPELQAAADGRDFEADFHTGETVAAHKPVIVTNFESSDFEADFHNRKTAAPKSKQEVVRDTAPSVSLSSILNRPPAQAAILLQDILGAPRSDRY